MDPYKYRNHGTVTLVTLGYGLYDVRGKALRGLLGSYHGFGHYWPAPSPISRWLLHSPLFPTLATHRRASSGGPHFHYDDVGHVGPQVVAERNVR